MSNLGDNPLWKDTSAATPPSYSYSDHVPAPSTLGVGSGGSFSQLYQNGEAIGTYVGDLLDSSTPMGDQYFTNTGGMCVAPDGSSKIRSNYINNQSYGLIPGILEDIGGLNPAYLFESLLADGDPPCKCYKCPTSTGSQYGFLTPSISPDFDAKICQEVDVSNCSTTESFVSSSGTDVVGIVIALGLLCIFSSVN